MEELDHITSLMVFFDEKIKLNSNLDFYIYKNEKEIKNLMKNNSKPRWYKLVVLCFFEKKSEIQNFSDWNYQQIHFI